ncbi:MAG: malto-oligosyltrehalose trehalohydrolase [Sphingobacteriales bacterium]|nr:MAG: malto-oligosyltrehalose trehalohydrolase [Sphingobacteriales bacterium]
MQIDLLRRKIGLNFNDDGFAEVWLWAPNANKVNICIQKTEHRLDMLAKEYGYWYLKTEQIRPFDAYSFELEVDTDADNAKLKRADPASIYQHDGVFEDSTAFDLGRFEWTDQNWKPIAVKDYIIYEIHTGTFTPEGDFEAVINKLDYLVELGITAIEIMPVSQFSGNRNWGYDGVFPFAVQNTYGGPQQLQKLVNACHNKGIAVILDVVYNHVGPEGNYFNDFGAYFTEKYNTPWGNAINFDDAYCDGVRTFFIENALMWFRDFHIDALRLDAVHAIKDFSPKHILAEIKQHVDKLAKENNRPYHLMVELDLNDNRYINSQQQGGYGMDAQWIDEFHHTLRVAAGQEKTGYYADFNGIEDLAKAYNDAYVYNGQYSEHRKKKFGVETENPGEQFIVFSQNHDHVGNRMLGERTSTLVSFEMLKVMAGAVLCAPYLPLIFMGEEWAETNPFQFFISHSDEELVEAVRKGRKAEFSAFHIEGEAPDPQDEATFNRSKLDWNKAATGMHKTMLAYYKTLIRLRKENAAFNDLNRKNTQARAITDKNTLFLTRSSEEQTIICLLNFSKNQQNLQLNLPGNMSILLNSATTEFGGPQPTANAIQHNGEISIAPESILIFSN